MKKSFRKAIIIFIIIVVSLAGTFGVLAITGTDISKIISGFGPGTTTKGSVEALFQEMDVDKIRIENITQTVDFEDMQQKKGIDFGRILISTNIYTRDLCSFHKTYPVECIRKVDDDTLYVIYKTQNDQGNIIYMYCFFERTIFQKTNTDADKNADVIVSVAPSAEAESWELSGLVFYSMKTLSYADFSSVAVGSKMPDVYAIDPVTSIYVPYANPDWTPTGNETAWIDEDAVEEGGSIGTSRHLLQDGILEIVYCKNAQDERVVKEIRYHKDYKLTLGTEEKNRYIPVDDLPKG